MSEPLVKAKITTRYGAGSFQGRTARFQIFVKGYMGAAKESMRKMAEEFRISLVLNIVTQRFSGTFDPLSPAWKKWKAKHGASPNFWVAYGDLHRAITVRETKKGYSVGAELGVYPTRSTSFDNKRTEKTAIWKYLFYNEFGRGPIDNGKFKVGPQPARPTIAPTRANLGEEFWTQKMRKEFEKKVAEAWMEAF